jgi:hypothetical protein
MDDFLEDSDDQSDTGSDLFATAIICLILLITVLITQVGSSAGKAQFEKLEGNWILLFSTPFRGDKRFDPVPEHKEYQLTHQDSSRDAKGTIPKGERFKNHEFDWSEGAIVRVDVRATQFDPYAILYGPDGKEITRDDDSGEGLNSQIEVMIAQSGGYELMVTSYKKNGLGNYVIDVSKTFPTASPTDWDVPDTEVSNVSGNTIVHVYGGANRLIPMQGQISSALFRVLGPLGIIDLEQSTDLDENKTNHCLQLTIDTATLENCD